MTMKFPIISRQEAYDLQRKRFYTGKPCKRGHDAQRFVSTGNCVACNSAASMAWRTGHDNRQGMFTYPAHPDDFAALHAYAQALDMQRGRVPQPNRTPPDATPVPRGAEPAHIEQRRRELAEHLAAQRAVPAYVPKP